jgi:type II secretory pathway component GspD/PulD (secretin)
MYRERTGLIPLTRSTSSKFSSERIRHASDSVVRNGPCREMWKKSKIGTIPASIDDPMKHRTENLVIPSRQTALPPVRWALLFSVMVVTSCMTGAVDPELADVKPAEPVDVSESPTPQDPVEAAGTPADRLPDKGMLDAVEELYEAGDYNSALLTLIDVSRENPLHPEIERMRQKLLTSMSEQRALKSVVDADISDARMAIEATEQSAIPDTYRLEQVVDAKLDSHSPPPSELKKALSIHVSMHLKGASLSSFVDAISKSANLNIISDKGLAEGKSVDIEVDDVPLQEILDYISRNYGVQFYMGKNLMWVTAAAKTAAPLETRVYPLHKGIQYHGSDWGEAKAGDPLGLSLKATELAGSKNYILDIIERFVPEVEGAQSHFDANVHTLFVRNTPENIELIEQIITTLDVTPIQVLIEARFVEVVAADLREVGIEWILDSPLTVSEKGVLQDGNVVRVPASQINKGATASFDPFTSDLQGPNPLGPQGAFGDLRTGNPATAAQGVNFTYQGILTEPMFSAVLHALEISGKSRTLSVPRVTTINNSPAKLRNGEDLRFYEEFNAQAFSLVDDDNKKYSITVLIPKGKPELEELGITLVAVPSVGKDMKTISLMLTPTISRLEGFISYQDDSSPPGNNQPALAPDQIVAKLPIVSRREIQTKIVVESGETVVLGGLMETVKQDTVYRIPILGSLPLIGPLFSRTDATEEQKNLLVFVTATVINERGVSLVPRR